MSIIVVGWGGVDWNGVEEGRLWIVRVRLLVQAWLCLRKRRQAWVWRREKEGDALLFLVRERSRGGFVMFFSVLCHRGGVGVGWVGGEGSAAVRAEEGGGGAV